MSGQKRLFNRFDYYQVASIFTQTTEEYLSRKQPQSRRKIYIQAFLGLLLFINGFLSHWGPWPWPSNYYLIAFSVVFYHAATYVYSSFNGINTIQGNYIGHYKFNDQVKCVVLKIGEDKQNFELCVSEKDKGIIKICQFNYVDYFTGQGYFLLAKYKKILRIFIDSVKKSTTK